MEKNVQHINIIINEISLIFNFLIEIIFSFLGDFVILIIVPKQERKSNVSIFKLEDLNLFCVIGHLALKDVKNSYGCEIKTVFVFGYFLY